MDDNRNELSKCIPFVSEYTDCTEENRCTGCNKCVCVAEDRWSCSMVADCPEGQSQDVDEESLDTALERIRNEIEYQEESSAVTSRTPYVPSPSEEKDLLLEFASEKNSFDDRMRALMRSKRSVDEQNNQTDAVLFHHTVDELNEDTLKHGNLSGTLQAHKKEALATLPKASRRNGVLPTDNLPQNNLHIEFNQPKVYDDHLTDNKIDDTAHTDNKSNEDRIKEVTGNHTLNWKDKDLSKLIVNELKSGIEIIGDKSSPVMSNITFTPENDTLTAMAYIAGNLLNKLWNIEKDSGEDSRETEALKHEKIADLLDLFKEPLNIRQENFLKSALKQLSEAIDKNKNLSNVSLCEKIDEYSVTNKNTKETSNSEKEDAKNDKTSKMDSGTRKTYENESPVNTETISKVNNVLSLIKKYQQVQKKLNNLKITEINDNEPKHILKNIKTYEETQLTQDESESLNVFGSILEKITKLLMPPKKSKKMVKNIKNQNVLTNNGDFVKKVKNEYGIDIDQSSLTVKDKILFDYLNTVKKNPHCILDSLRKDDTKSMSYIEGDILLNLSEFFKVKSFVDLVNLLEPNNKPHFRSSDITTTERETTTEPTTMFTIEVTSTTQVINKLSKTKEKLKTHLKTILDDLIELQNAKGQPTKNITIADALPCIFKLMNADSNALNKNHDITTKKTSESQAARVAAIFDSLRKDLKTTQNRRSNSNIMPGERPKSAIVWERMVKNFDGKSRRNTRRNMEFKAPKPFDEIKKQIELIESASNTYKSLAFTNGVPASDRQILLKTLLEDIRQYTNVLSDIQNSLDNSNDINVHKKKELEEFIDNAAVNIDLNKKLVTDIVIYKIKSNNIPSVINKYEKQPKESFVPKKSMRMVDLTRPNEKNSVKLSRDVIINQLIKNRMQLYIKIKESKGTDLSEDLNYDIAKKILVYLDSGHQNLARELYKVLITPKQKIADPNANRFTGPSSNKKPVLLVKEPLVHFEEPTRGAAWLGQQAWLKQLVNLKNMRA